MFHSIVWAGRGGAGLATSFHFFVITLYFSTISWSSSLSPQSSSPAPSSSISLADWIDILHGSCLCTTTNPTDLSQSITILLYIIFITDHYHQNSFCILMGYRAITITSYCMYSFSFGKWLWHLKKATIRRHCSCLKNKQKNIVNCQFLNLKQAMT